MLILLLNFNEVPIEISLKLWEEKGLSGPNSTRCLIPVPYKTILSFNWYDPVP
jgi:hypothetical protein